MKAAAVILLIVIPCLYWLLNPTVCFFPWAC